MITPIAPSVPATTETGLMSLVAFLQDKAAQDRLRELMAARDEHDAARDVARAAIVEQASVTEGNRRDAEANKAAAADLARQRQEFAQERAESQQRLMKADKELEAQRQSLAKEIAAWGEKRAEEERTIEASRDKIQAEILAQNADRLKLDAEVAEARKLMETAKGMKAEAQRQLDEMAAIIGRRSS